MNITIRELGERLAKYAPVFRITSDQVVSACRVVHKKLQILEPNIVYIGNSSHLSDKIVFSGHVNIVLITSEPIPSILNDNLMVNLIVLPDKYDGIPVINEIQDIFATDRFVSEAISKWLYALSQGWGLQKLLDLCYKLLGNPVLLMDSSTNLIAHSGDVSQIDEPAWQSHLSHGYVTAKYYDLYEKEVKSKYDINLDYRPMLMESKLWRHRVFLNRVVFQNRILAYLEVLEYKRKFREEDSKLISLMSNALAIEVQRSKFASGLPETTVDAFILNLLQNKEPNSGFVEEMANYLHLKTDESLFIICVEPGNNQGGNEKKAYMKSMLERAIPCIHAVEFKDQVVLLMSRKKVQQEADGILYFKHFLSSNNLVAGISRYYSNLMELYTYYQQAAIAIKMGRRINKEKYLYVFEEYMGYYVMHLSSEKVDLNELCSPGLTALIELDRKKKSQYALTLYYFIQNNLDMQKTSDELHVHYNTLKYRLQKIEEVYGLKVTSKSIQLSLRLSFIMLEYIHQLDFEKYWFSCMA